MKYLTLFLILFSLASCREKAEEKQRVERADQMSLEQLREVLKGYTEAWETGPSDQKKGVPVPSIEKPFDENSRFIDLLSLDKLSMDIPDLKTLIGKRRSRRSYTEDSLSIMELSYLLWGTQGISKVFKNDEGRVKYHFRTVPSGGARHPFETYLYLQRIQGVDEGVYRYLPLENRLLLVRNAENLSETVSECALGQKFVGSAAAVFFWVAVPYRMEWRYQNMAYKDILIEAGHICQNLYLMSESINCGTCAIAAYDQDKTDTFLGVDGKNEITVYLAPVGKVE